MTEAVRKRLPNRRGSASFSLQCAGLDYIATVSPFDDGRPGEIFLHSPKTGSAADVVARDSAIVCSIALQYGADINVIRKALTHNADGSASGPLGTVLDLLAVSS